MINYIINIDSKIIHHMTLEKPKIKEILIKIEQILINMVLLTISINLK